MCGVGAEPVQVHPPVSHGLADLATEGVIPHGAQEAGPLFKCLEVPGHVEGRSAKDRVAVRERVEQDLAKDADQWVPPEAPGPLRWDIELVASERGGKDSAPALGPRPSS
jgi:hypothetical protein